MTPFENLGFTSTRSLSRVIKFSRGIQWPLIARLCISFEIVGELSNLHIICFAANDSDHHGTLSRVMKIKSFANWSYCTGNQTGRTSLRKCPGDLDGIAVKGGIFIYPRMSQQNPGPRKKTRGCCRWCTKRDRNENIWSTCFQGARTIT
jgi:hypothetical protein